MNLPDAPGAKKALDGILDEARARRLEETERRQRRDGLLFAGLAVALLPMVALGSLAYFGLLLGKDAPKRAEAVRSVPTLFRVGPQPMTHELLQGALDAQVDMYQKGSREGAQRLYESFQARFPQCRFSLATPANVPALHGTPRAVGDAFDRLIPQLREEAKGDGSLFIATATMTEGRRTVAGILLAALCEQGEGELRTG